MNSAFDGVCELVIDGERHKAIYSDSGVVLIENKENCTLVYNGKQLIIPEPIKLEYAAFRLDIFFFDLGGDGKEELIFDHYWDEWDNYFYPVDLEKMEFVSIDYTASSVEDFFNYGIEKTETMEDGSIKAYFYIENNSAERIVGDVRLENIEADWQIDMIPVVKRIYRRNATTLLGNTQFCVYSPDNKEFEDLWRANLFGEGKYDAERDYEYQKTLENIHFKTMIEYDNECGKYIPAENKLTFSWIDSQGQEHEEKLTAVKKQVEMQGMFEFGYEQLKTSMPVLQFSLYI